MSLSEDVKLVLPAADMLDHDLTQLYSSACKDHGSFHPFDQDFDHYEVGFFLPNPPKFPNRKFYVNCSNMACL